jgi:hypothetical protein
MVFFIERNRVVPARLWSNLVQSQNSDEPSMTSKPDSAAQSQPVALSLAAKRALAEAEARRKAGAEDAARAAARPKEIGGPAGPEPTRHGDWERKGIASDF